MHEPEESELAALIACDKAEGLSTEGRFPGILHVDSLVKRKLLEHIKKEVVGGWRVYNWFRTTDWGRAYLASKAAPVDW